MTSRNSGFSLAEVVVAAFVGALTLVVLGTVFVNFRRSAESPLASTALEQSTLSLVSKLRGDLEETNLQSVRTCTSGVVMESPRDDNGNLLPFVKGGAVWNRYLYYTVKPIASAVPLPATLQLNGVTIKPQLGELDYDEDSSDANLGIEPLGPKTYLAGPPHPEPQRHRVLAHNLLLDASAPNPSRVGFWAYYNDPDSGPTDLSETQRGEPVSVALTLMDLSSSTGQPSLRRLLVQVKPRN